MSKKVTIRDVAAKAKVSLATVNRVLQNKGRVSEQKTIAVQEAVKELNYKPNLIAQSLALQKRNIRIGVIYPEVEKYFWHEVKKGIMEAQKTLGQFGVEIIVKSTTAYNVKEQIDALNYLIKQNINGIAMIAFHPSKLNFIIDELMLRKIPVVTFISDAPKSKRICFVGTDNYKSGNLGAKLMELYLRGKGNVAVLGVHRDVLCIQQRVSGFIEKSETEYPDINIIGIYDTREYKDVDEQIYREEVYNITCKIIDELPDLDGIYVTNSLTSCVGKAIKDLKKQGIIVIGHERSEEISQLIEEDIVNATIYQDPFSEVYFSIHYLYNYLTKNKVPKKQIINTELQILIKENNGLDSLNRLLNIE